MQKLSFPRVLQSFTTPAPKNVYRILTTHICWVSKKTLVFSIVVGKCPNMCIFCFVFSKKWLILRAVFTCFTVIFDFTKFRVRVTVHFRVRGGTLHFALFLVFYTKTQKLKPIPGGIFPRAPQDSGLFKPNGSRLWCLIRDFNANGST